MAGAISKNTDEIPKTSDPAMRVLRNELADTDTYYIFDGFQSPPLGSRLNLSQVEFDYENSERT